MDIADNAKSKVDDKWSNNPYQASAKKGSDKNFVQMNMEIQKNSINGRSTQLNWDIRTQSKLLQNAASNIQNLLGHSSDRNSVLSRSIEHNKAEIQPVLKAQHPSQLNISSNASLDSGRNFTKKRSMQQAQRSNNFARPH